MLIPLWQRLLGFLVYMLPWSDAFSFGLIGGIAEQLTWFNLLFIPTIPINIFERIFPFGLGNLIIFLMLFLTVIRNPKAPYFLRFNALQALLINIVMILIGIGFFGILPASLTNTLIFKTLCSTVCIGMFSILIFVLIECIQGKEPDVPGISGSVRMQL